MNLSKAISIFFKQNERCSIMMKFFTVLVIFVAAIASINRALAQSEENVEKDERLCFVNNVQEQEE